MGLLTTTLLSVVFATPRSRLLTLDLGGRALDYRAGQAVSIGPSGGASRRPYSIANAPSVAARTGHIELLVGADGSIDLDWAVPGAPVDVEGPLGSFTFDPSSLAPHVLLVAGGVGISPMRSMLQEMLALKQRPAVTLLYSARRTDEFAFIDEFAALAGQGAIALHQTVTRDDANDWQGGRGRIGPSEFEAAVHSPAATTCFVCGPNALVAETVAALTALGVPPGEVRTEQWGRG